MRLPDELAYVQNSGRCRSMWPCPEPSTGGRDKISVDADAACARPHRWRSVRAIAVGLGTQLDVGFGMIMVGPGKGGQISRFLIVHDATEAARVIDAS
jgi:hypothetical protein